MVEQGPRTRGALEREAAADRGSDGDLVERARRAHELDDPALQQPVDVDGRDSLAHHVHVLDADHRLQPAQRMAMPLLVHDLQLLVGRRIPERRLEEEAVELRLGERERPLVLDRVFGRDQQERVGQHARLPVDRDLVLRHRLQQRRLRLRHGAVDLVDEHDIRKDRPRPELEFPLALVVDRQPGDVRRLQVRRALDPRRRRALDRLRDRPREDGLRRAGNILEQDMTAADEGGEDELDLLVLAVDDRLDVLEKAVSQRGSALKTVRPL